MVIQEDQAGELGLQRLYLKYYNVEGFEAPPESETYYPNPSIESLYRTCDTRLTDALTDVSP